LDQKGLLQTPKPTRVKPQFSAKPQTRSKTAQGQDNGSALAGY